ncbi:hypothetical protein [Oceanobacillus jeddahense]|uniref:hypothetical protein n=1 Tax=Oceanobacillus jeddahense TaxID=1462527 RepID=UPI0005962703|nr:hypothetical protein [Oceanobacillus jeddahense]
MSDYNQVKLDNGLVVNGQRINDITDVKIESNVDNLSKVTVTFIAKVDGLDNIKPTERYMFTDETEPEDSLTDRETSMQFRDIKNMVSSRGILQMGDLIRLERIGIDLYQYFDISEIYRGKVDYEKFKDVLDYLKITAER